MSLSVIVALLLGIGLVGGLLFIGRLWNLFSAFYWRRVFVVACALLLGLIAGLLPLTKSDPSQVITNSDVIFLVDTTYSMNALDGRDKDTRLTDVQHDIASMVKQMGASRFGMVIFDQVATLYLPLTSTASDITTAAAVLSTSDYVDATGNPTLTGALNKLKDYLASLRTNDVTRQRVLVVMTDGELTGTVDTTDSVMSAARSLAPSVNASVVIGYGTAAGAKMPYIVNDFDDNGNGRLVRKPGMYAEDLVDGTFGPIISRRNDQNLQNLASNLRGTYIHAEDNGVVQTVVDARQKAASRRASSPESRALHQNILHVPVAIVLLAWLVAVEILSVPRIRRWLSQWKGRT